ncbi:hypothetical protein L2E82_04893 [Cichorium intybus]|uniref:Uncharacterized protein n=1 Tax=Cichorium intybus TaxID=13427 RepID=A0ACB9H6Q4_CICIN|nr:hypothetical protein L2E82_04893 [Cichorium intybus]
MYSVHLSDPPLSPSIPTTTVSPSFENIDFNLSDFPFLISYVFHLSSSITTLFHLIPLPLLARIVISTMHLAPDKEPRTFMSKSHLKFSIPELKIVSFWSSKIHAMEPDQMVLWCLEFNFDGFSYARCQM